MDHGSWKYTHTPFYTDLRAPARLGGSACVCRAAGGGGMSAPANWLPTPALKAVTAEACRRWKLEHPGRRLAPDATPDEKRRGCTDDEFRETAWTFHRVPIEVVPIIAGEVLTLSKGHWPRLAQLRDAVDRYLARQAAPSAPRAAAVPEADAAARRQDAQCQAMLRALKLDGKDVSILSRMRAIAAATEACVWWIEKKIRDGEFTRAHMVAFREARGPEPERLEEIVRELAEMGRVQVHGHAATMAASMAAGAA